MLLVAGIYVFLLRFMIDKFYSLCPPVSWVSFELNNGKWEGTKEDSRVEFLKADKADDHRVVGEHRKIFGKQKVTVIAFFSPSWIVQSST